MAPKHKTKDISNSSTQMRHYINASFKKQLIDRRGGTYL